MCKQCQGAPDAALEAPCTCLFDFPPMGKDTIRVWEKGPNNIHITFFCWWYLGVNNLGFAFPTYPKYGSCLVIPHWCNLWCFSHFRNESLSRMHRRRQGGWNLLGQARPCWNRRHGKGFMLVVVYKMAISWGKWWWTRGWNGFPHFSPRCSDQLCWLGPLLGQFHTEMIWLWLTELWFMMAYGSLW